MSSVTVSVDLQSEQEIVVFSQFLQIIITQRAKQEQIEANLAAAKHTDPQPTPPPQYTGPQLVKNDAPTATPAPAPVVQPAPTQTYTGHEPKTAPAPAPAAPAIDRAAVEAKFREYIPRVGTAAARTLLDKYGAPFLKDVPAERLAEFLAEISA